MSKFNPDNYPPVSPAQDDVVLLWQRSTNSVKSATVASLASELQLAETIDALKAIATADLADGSTALVNGYYAAGDGGGGSFYYDQTSGATDNGGTVIAPDSGTGRWLRVYSGPLNVKWFGAKGDGVTNDTTRIQAAIDFAATAGGGNLVFPIGTYLCVGVVLKENVTLQGNPGGSGYLAHNPGVILKASGTGYIIDTPSSQILGGGVRGFLLQGLGAGTACVGIRLRNCSRSAFEYLFFDSFADQAILFSSSSNIACYFRYIQSQNCLLNRTRSAQDGVFYVDGSDHFFDAIELTASVTGAKTTQGRCNAFYVGGANHFFSNCIGEISDSGFYIAGSGLNRFSNTRSDLNQMYGFYCDVGASSFVGCLALNNSQDTSNTYSGWYAAANTAQGMVLSACKSVSSVAKVHKYGFEDLAEYASATARNFYSNSISTGHGTQAYYVVETNALGSAVSLPPVSIWSTATGSITQSVEQATDIVLTQGSATTITDFTGGVSGQSIFLRGNANVTIANNSTIKTSTGANKTLVSNKIYQFKKSGSVWYEVTN